MHAQEPLLNGKAQNFSFGVNQSNKSRNQPLFGLPAKSWNNEPHMNKKPKMIQKARCLGTYLSVSSIENTT
jgi:hypothetical protein